MTAAPGPPDATALSRLQRHVKNLEDTVLALRVLLSGQEPFAMPASEARPSGAGGLRPVHEMLHAVVNHMRLAIVVTDPNLDDNPIIFANRAFETMTGFSQAELLGRNCRFMQGEDTEPHAIARISDAMRDRTPLTIDMRSYRRDRTSFVAELHISPVLGPDGDLRYFIGCLTDATEIRATASRLLGTEGRWRRWFQGLQEGFVVGEVVRDPDGRPINWRYLEVNEAWSRISGLLPGQAVGRLSTEVRADANLEWLVDFAAVADTGEPRVVNRRVARSGRTIEARIFRPDPGQFALVFTDVTDRIRDTARRDMLLELADLLREDMPTDRLLYRVTALLGRTLEIGRAGYGTIDPVTETIVVPSEWNAPGVAPITGTLRLRDYGSYVEDLKRGRTVTIEDTRLDPRTAGNSAALEAIGVRSLVNLPIIEQGGIVALLFLNHHQPRAWTGDDLSLLRDVAERTRAVVERRRAEQALRDLTASLEAEVVARTHELMATEEKLRQSQKMEAVGQLTGGLAHDFNNLLTGITGSLELIVARIAQGRTQDLERYVTAAQGATRRAAALTHRLLAFSRRQTLDPRPTDINELVSGMEEMVRRTVGPSVQVEAVGLAGIWPARVDPNQLENALLNLCINARDAMPDGGRITIETANMWLDDRGAAERDLAPGQYVSLSVTDTGTGMEPDVVARAFDPFFTTKPIGQGTGLGLSMIYGFARQSGGQVRIYSEVGRGTTMRLYLPRHHGDGAERTDHEPESTPALAEAGETVLVVDDEPTVRMLILEVLDGLGYTALEAGDGPAGLRILQSDARVDLLITDVGLPGMNGRQMADAARIARPALKVLFITGYAENAVVGNGYLDPDMHILTKPFTLDMLGVRIKTLLRAG